MVGEILGNAQEIYKEERANNQKEYMAIYHKQRCFEAEPNKRLSGCCGCCGTCLKTRPALVTIGPWTTRPREQPAERREREGVPLDYLFNGHVGSEAYNFLCKILSWQNTVITIQKIGGLFSWHLRPHCLLERAETHRRSETHSTILSRQSRRDFLGLQISFRAIPSITQEIRGDRIQ